MACMRGQLAGAAPAGAGLYSVTLQGLRQGCIAAGVPGADVPLQVRNELYVSANSARFYIHNVLYSASCNCQL